MGSEKQGLKKILAFLRRLGLVASSRRSDKERAARDGRRKRGLRHERKVRVSGT